MLTPTALAAAESTVTIGASPHHAYLQINGRTLIDQPDAHLARPLFSPDDRSVVVVVTPSGAETAHLAQLHLFDIARGQRLALLSGHSPTWAATSAAIHFQSGDQLFTYQLATQRTIPSLPNPQSTASSLQPPIPTLHPPISSPYPTTIRVRHHPSNGCRHVPADQVDEIPFETYVARVVPAEMPALWPVDALAAQAVAARTYAWRQILVGRPDYDVSDWADFQVMCDERYPASDAATANTAGQYLSEVGDLGLLPISAMYSAENGHPTLTNPDVNYLQATPDLFALGRVRFGHGYGLSQWGAQRRALAGHTYRQILAHYYSNVHLQNALEPTQALGAFGDPTLGDWWATGALRWQALTAATVTTVTVGITATHRLTATSWFSGLTSIWRSPVALPTGATLTATLWMDGIQQDQVGLPVDMTPPPPPTTTIQTVTNTTFLLTVNAENDTLIGLQEDWRWQGEALAHTPASGRVVSDALASNGVAWAAQAGVDEAGVWYGPYTTALPAGRSYRALFWLRAPLLPNALATTQPVTPVARLDVTDDLGNLVLGLRDLWPSDFISATLYQPITVDFHLFDPPKGVELRVAWPGLVDLALDKVEVWTLPSAEWRWGASLIWKWSGGSWPPVVAVAAFDPAGHVSQPISQSAPISDDRPPGLTITQTARSPDVVQLAWQAQDDLSGVALVELEVQEVNSEWRPSPQSPLTTSVGSLYLTLATNPLPIRLRAVDRAGQRSDWHPLVLQRVPNWLYLPLVVHFR
jgi:hypothetical protein